jgi:Ribose/xylose/arabinose/galactoside ABC-type transport systems, permease components
MKINNLIKKYAMVLVLILLIALFTIGNPLFFSIGNFINVFRQVSMLAIVAIGMTFVLISGGIDLAVGSQLSFIGVLIATLVSVLGINPFIACLIGIAATTFIGMINGIIISKTKVPPLIVTLAMMQILQGLGFIISRGVPVYGLPESLKFLGQGYLGPVPVPIIIMVIIMLAGAFILNKTYIGRYFYATGSNEEAARLSGLSVTRIKITAYMSSGFFSGIAGIIMMGRINSGNPTAGRSFEMDVLTAAVLGGVSVLGGEGKVFGAFIGVLIIGVLSNGLIIMGINEYYQLMIKGLVLLFAVIFDSLNNKKAR